MKRCLGCGEIKPLSEFHKHSRHKDKRQSYCKPCHYAQMNESRKRLPGPIRASYRRRMYGLSPQAYDAMHEAQGGRCAICSEPFTKTPHVDHDHDTDRVRALLCDHCNHGLGRFRDKIELLLEAAKYLRKHGKAEVHEEFTAVQPATRETA